MDDIRIISEISRGHVRAAGPYSTPVASGSIRQSTKKTIPVKADLGRHAAEEHAALAIWFATRGRAIGALSVQPDRRP
jgi:hypothetical protein